MLKLRRRRSLVLHLACVSLCAGACSVDLGATSTVACAPSPAFFVSDVWPRYLVANRCGSGGCHDFAGGHGTLRLRDVTGAAAPAAGRALDAWPMAWRENYLATIHLYRCDAPLESRLLSVPEGSPVLHPPGPVVLDRVTARDVMQRWVAQP